MSLHDAIIAEDLAQVHSILSQAPNIQDVVNAKNEFGESPLDWAIAYDDVAMADILWNHGARSHLDREGVIGPVHQIVFRNCLSVLQWILKGQADDGCPKLNISNKDDMGHTPLDLAIVSNKLEIARTLYAHNAKTNRALYVEGGDNPIHKAAAKGHLAMLKWIFLETDLVPNKFVTADDRATVMDAALFGRDEELVHFLWGMGIRGNPAFYANTSYTGVHDMAHSGETELLEWCFRENVVPWSALFARDEYGYTPAEIAAQWDLDETYTLLLRLQEHFQEHFTDVCVQLHLAKQSRSSLLSRLPVELLDLIREKLEKFRI